MAETIKGIQVKIEGDTKSLGNALKNIDTNIKATEKNLKQVDKLLSLDPTNVSLTAEKEKLLAQNIEEVSKKLLTLKNVQSQVEEQYKNGDIGTEAYLDFQKQLVQTEQQYDKLYDTANAVNTEINQSVEENTEIMKDYYLEVENTTREVEESTDKHEKHSKSLKKVGKAIKTVTSALGKMTTATAKASLKAINTTVSESIDLFGDYSKAVVGAVASVSALSLNAGTSFTSQMSTVQALLGFTEGTQEQTAIMKQLEDRASSVGAATQYTATEVGQAYEYMAMASWNSTEMLDGLNGIINLNSVAGIDLATTSDIVTDSLTAFGLGAEESTHFADVLATTITKSNTNVEGLGEAFKYVGPIANSLGYSIEDVSMALGIMANAGVKGEQAGNALKTSLSRLASPSKQAQEVINRLGISLADENGNTLGFADMLDQLRDKLKGVDAELVNADGSLKEYEELEEELTGKNKQLQLISDASNLFGKNQVASMLTLINATDEEFEELKKSIDEADGSAEAMAQVKLDNLTGDAIILESAVEGIGLSIFDNIESPMRTLVQSVSKFMTEINEDIKNGFDFENMGHNMDTFSKSLLSQFKFNSKDIINVINKVSILVNWAIEDVVKGIIETFPTIMGEILPSLIDNYWNLINNFIDQITGSAPELVSSAENVINSFATGLASASNNIKNSLPNIIDSLTTGINDVAPNVIEMGVSILDTIATGISLAVPKLPSIAYNIVNSLINSLSQTDFDISTFADNIFTALTQIITGLGNVLTDSGIIESFSSTFVEILTGAIGFVADNIDTVVNVVMTLVNSLINALTENAEPILEGVATLIENVVIGLTEDDNLTKLVTGILNLVSNVALALTSPDVLTKLLDAVLELIDGVLVAVVENIQPLTDCVVSLFSAVCQIIADPDNLAKILEVLGVALVEIVNGAGVIVLEVIPDLVESIFTKFVGWFKDKDWSTIGNKIIDGLWQGINDKMDWLGGKIIGIGDRIVGGFNDGLEIQSPSRKLKRETGQYILPGVAEGVEDSVPSFVSDMGNVSDTIVKSMDFSGAIGSMTANLSNIVIPDVPSLPRMDGYNQSVNNISNNTNNSYSSSYGSLFSGANIYINNDNDIESLAEKLQFYMQKNSMGVGVA